MKEIIVLVGVAGSGKSTYIENNRTKKDLIVSSDSIRLELFETLEEGNKHNQEVFEIVRNRIFKNLKNDNIDRIFFDATNLNRKRRINFYNEVKRINKDIKVKIIFFDLTLEELYERNVNREVEKQVPLDVIYNQWLSLEVCKQNVDCDEYDVIIGEQEYIIDKDLEHDSVFHRETVKEHIDLCIQNTNKYDKDRDILVEVAKYHDLGKFFTKKFIKNDTENKRYKFAIETYGKMAQFKSHEKISARIYLRKMKKENLLADDNAKLILEVIYQHNLAHTGFSEKYIDREKLTKRELEVLKEFEKIDDVSRVYDKEILKQYQEIEK